MQNAETINPPNAVRITSTSPTSIRAEWNSPNADQLEKIETMRSRIEQHFIDLGLKPAAILAKFDNRKPTFPEKRAAYLEIMAFVISEKTKMVIEGAAYSTWDLKDIERYLAKFDCSNGFNSAPPAKILEMWADMKKDRMFEFAKIRP